MTKKEFLAMSIFSNLKNLDDNNKIVELHCVDNGIGLVNFGWGDAKEFTNVKPILHPLSDLTKEIEHIKSDLSINTESENYNYLGVINHAHAFSLDGTKVGIMAMPFFFIQKLIEKHFDVCSLIDKGEAIDVNTLTENPYK